LVGVLRHVLTCRELGLRMSALLGALRAPLIGCAAILASVVGLREGLALDDSSHLLFVFLAGSLGALAYFAALALTDRRLVFVLLTIARDGLRRPSAP
jgi:hypothetical protein